MNPLRILSPQILVLEPDDDTRPLLKHNLQTWGYRVMLALDKIDALERAHGRLAPIALILLNQAEQSTDDVIAIGRQIRLITDLEPPIPILIMAEQYGLDLEGQDVQIGAHEYVTYLEDGQPLKRLLQRLCPV